MKYVLKNRLTGKYLTKTVDGATFGKLENAIQLDDLNAHALVKVFAECEVEAYKPASSPERLARRLTHKYNDGHSHLDRWHNLGTFAGISAEVIHDNGESYEVKLTVNVDLGSKYRTANVINALLDSVESACTCEHDCCGHYRRSGHSATHIDGNTYEVVVSAHRNI